MQVVTSLGDGMNLLGKRIKEELVSLSGLKIIIIGGGVVGTALVEQLSIENHDITVIDTSAQKIQKITKHYVNKSQMHKKGQIA